MRLKKIYIFQVIIRASKSQSMYMGQRGQEIEIATRVLDVAIFGHSVINEKIGQIVLARLGPLPRFHNLKELTRRW